MMERPVTYLLWSNGRQQWWKPDEAGYTSDQDEAGEYSLERAIELVVASANCGVLDQVSVMVAAPSNWRD